MICPACSGNGYIRLRKTGWRPCFNCNGSGVAHCCDGDKPTDFERNSEGQHGD